MNKFTPIKIGRVSLKHAVLEEFNPEEETRTVDTKAFMEAVKQYGNYRESFIRSQDLQNKIKEIGQLIADAEVVTLQETDQWFDKMTVQRHVKQLKEAYKVMQKTGSELIQNQQRFESAYEDIGTILGKYFTV